MARKDDKADQAAVIDIDDNLIAYAEKILGHEVDLAQALVDAAQSDLTGLDELFKDGGQGRKEATAIATGYLVDKYQLSGQELTDRSTAMTQQAITYLKHHGDQFDQWAR